MKHLAAIQSEFLKHLAFEYEDTELNSETIRSRQDAKVFLEVPLVRQSTSFSCGAASFLSVLGYYGFSPREQQIMQLMDTSFGGTDPESFVKAAKFFKLKTEMKENISHDTIVKLLNENVPVVLAIQAWNGDKNKDYKNEWQDGHWVVTIGYDDEGYYFMDPSQIGYSYLTKKELDDRWHDKSKQNDKTYNRLAVIVYGKKPEFDYDEIRQIE